ncbi:MAG: NAD-binding protein [Burkholderiaceae bacterium]|nr:NAD-binding protein [Burkholderiaceae bacterium]
MHSILKRSVGQLLLLLAILTGTVLVIGVLYMLAMTHLEDSPRTFLQSIQWASETLTTTGYGADNRWNHPAVALFVILVQFLGQFLVLLVFPVFVLPYFEEQFEVKLPHTLPDMSGKVLFYRYGATIEALIEEFKTKGSPFVIFEEDMQVARKLRDRGFEVVFGNLGEESNAFAGVQNSRAVVANGDDHANANCTLVVREKGYTGPMYALADDPLYRSPMIQIGATEVFTPAHVLGAALASRASTRINPPAEGMHLLGAKVGMAEFRVRVGSSLANKSLGELHLREQHGVSVIGQWYGGAFTTSKGPETRIEPGAILVAVGRPESLQVVERMAMPIRRTGPIVLAGYGAVGHKVIELLHDADEDCVVIDKAAQAGVNVVGSVLEHATLKQANVREASAVILALSDDSESLFATAVVRDYAPGVPLIVRVLRSPNTDRLYRAGADFAISVGQVAGQILAFHLLDEQAIYVENRIKVIRVTAAKMDGAHPWNSHALERTGAKVVAIERDNEVMIEFDASFVVRQGDVLFVCGSLTALERYQHAFNARPAPDVGSSA